MSNKTEGILRRAMVNDINNRVESNEESMERERLSEEWGENDVWDTKELSEAFEVLSFMAPFCMVKRKSDGKKGSVMFQHSPRFYFHFQEV